MLHLEMTAIRCVLESFADEVRGKDMLHCIDNRNDKIVLSMGSRNKELHMEAVRVYRLCRELGMRLTVEWVSKDENMRADKLSRLENSNDYMLDPACFNYIDTWWGPDTIERFASLKKKQLERYCSRYHNPGCMAADAFTVSWSHEVNRHFPPLYLVSRALGYMSAGRENGTLIVPEWGSPSWWPLPSREEWELEVLH